MEAAAENSPAVDIWERIALTPGARAAELHARVCGSSVHQQVQPAQRNVGDRTVCPLGQVNLKSPPVCSTHTAPRSPPGAGVGPESMASPLRPASLPLFAPPLQPNHPPQGVAPMCRCGTLGVSPTLCPEARAALVTSVLAGRGPLNRIRSVQDSPQHPPQINHRGSTRHRDRTPPVHHHQSAHQARKLRSLRPPSRTERNLAALLPSFNPRSGSGSLKTVEHQQGKLQ